MGKQLRNYWRGCWLPQRLLEMVVYLPRRSYRGFSTMAGLPELRDGSFVEWGGGLCHRLAVDTLAGSGLGAPPRPGAPPLKGFPPPRKSRPPDPPILKEAQ